MEEKKEEQNMQSLGSGRISPLLTTSAIFESDYQRELMQLEE